MKTIGLVGGLSWESSIEYYRIINQEVRRRLGGFHNALSVMSTVDFADIVPLQHDLDFDGMEDHITAAALQVQRGGADVVLICSCTTNSVADRVAKHLDVPVLHIADATAEEIKRKGLKKVGLLGTRFTMEEDYFKGRLTERHGLEVIIPPADDRETVHRVIYDELVVGKFEDESRRKYREIMARLVERGAGCIILGCTEIGLLVGQDDSTVPVLDTTEIHAMAGVKFALDDED
ncbi:MAG: aspartate/glutamate racemase family protein [Pirellulales bacterium]|nr:aspartate/glutamate racemase family protein [Pirellulales bacterium]